MKRLILETERLKIFVPEQESLENRYNLLSDAKVTKYIGNGSPKTLSEVKKGLDKSIEHFMKYGFTLFDVFEKDSNEFIGEAGLIYLAFVRSNEDVEVGYKLHQKYWGKGYATELANAFIKWGFAQLNLTKIVACCFPENAASSKVMLKAGMKYQGKYLYAGLRECDIYEIKAIPSSS